MSATTVFIDGIGVRGPGLADWPQAAAVLRGEAAPEVARTVIPAPAVLPPAERRRAGSATKVALGVGQEALDMAGRRADMPAVFASSGGDGVNCHAICEALASSDRLISPTRFHNSVHNAPAGYWSIAMRSMAPTQALCGHDGSFAVGLLESMCQVRADGTPILLIAYDTEYPEPLYGVRPITDTFGVALLLAPQRGERTVATLTLDADFMCADAAETMGEAPLEAARREIPAARALPLLRALARGEHRRVVLDYQGFSRLAVGTGA